MPIQFIEAPNNFYLGARVDPATGQRIDEEPVYYDARHLTTHGVILGMTGSGKTGLGISILEEAAVDGIPQLIIDPKGDITNMLLAFPNFTAEHFLPWVNPKDAVQKNMDLEPYAQSVADEWRTGLEDWGISPDRIEDYRRSGKFSIYTPGSDAGLPVSILASFAAPSEGWDGNEEALREQITGIVTAVLGLIGVNARPVEDPEHILLSNIFEYNWRNHTDLSMEQLILQVQNPPFSKLGVLDVELVLDEKKRFDLAKKLNNIIAAPNFQSWIKGEPIHVPSLLYTKENLPRTTIFYLAHLNDAERQFIITLLLESMVSWMRSLSGSTSLRALVYIDEVFGLMPPYPLNPPTKDPIMRLLKQARAFGIGMLLSTQNPKDIDYKGLSNAGTWLIGKLQTDNDKRRVLEGLDSASEVSTSLNLETVDTLIGKLKPRQFIMHDVHNPETPIVMQTRWAMSFLSGPLTRDQVGRLMANQRENFQPSVVPQQPRSMMPSASNPSNDMAGHMGHVITPQAAAPGTDVPPTPRPEPSAPAYSGGQVSAVPAASGPDAPPPGFMENRPVLPSSIQQYYLPTEYSLEQAVRQWESWSGQAAIFSDKTQRLLYRPALLTQTTVRFTHAKTNSSEMLWYAFIVPNLPRVPFLNWAEYQSEPFDPQTLDPDPYQQALFAEVPSELSTGSGFKDLEKNLIDWIYQNAALYIYHSPVLNMYSSLYESQHDFLSRVQATARQKRDEEIDKIADKYDKAMVRLEDQARRKASRLENEREQLQARQQEELLSAGETVWRLMKGSAYQTLSRAGRLRRYSKQNEDQIDMVQEDLEALLDRLDATEYEMQEAMQRVQDKWATAVRQIDEIPVTPFKKDINVILFGLGWVPYWEAQVNNAPVILAASSSGLSYSQDPSLSGGGYY